MAIYDMHTHVLPRVDDGSRDRAMTGRMLASELSQGVTHVVATPHFSAWRYSFDHFVEKRQRGVERVRKYYKENPDEDRPQLFLGAEVGYFKGITNAPFLDQLAIQGTNTILIEMPWWEPWQDEFVDEVIDIRKSGFQVYLAHIERYFEDKANFPRLERMRAEGLHAHINAGSLLKWPGGGKLAKHYTSGLADLLASDTHNLDKRAPNIQAGRAVIEKKCGADKLHEIDTIGGLLLEGAISII